MFKQFFASASFCGIVVDGLLDEVAELRICQVVEDLLLLFAVERLAQKVKRVFRIRCQDHLQKSHTNAQDIVFLGSLFLQHEGLFIFSDLSLSKNLLDTNIADFDLCDVRVVVNRLTSNFSVNNPIFVQEAYGFKDFKAPFLDDFEHRMLDLPQELLQ